MNSKFNNYEGIQSIKEPDALLTEFMLKEKSEAFQLYDKNDDIKKFMLYLETKIIDFYYKNALNDIDLNTIKLEIVNKNN